MQPGAARDDVPLVVDLDGTLIATDVLHETASAQLLHSPSSLWLMARWLRHGRANLKRQLVARTDLDVSLLPYRADVLEWLRTEKLAGRRLVLASAADGVAVREIADHLGIFDETLGSVEGVNLRSAAKRAALVERFGEGGYDYVGNSSHDYDVWAAARQAHVVGATKSVVTRASELATLGRTFDAPRGSFVPAFLRSLRPHQWAKSVLVLTPLLLAHRLGDGSAIVQALLAFVAFCLASSSVYVFNDLSDIVNDRHHPTKRWRPFASGRLPLSVGWASWPLLMTASLVIGGALLPWEFFVTLAGYLALTFAYTLWLKRQPVLDVVALACLYTARVVAGAKAIDVVLSMWLLTFSVFFFMGLALIKRVSELTRIRRELGRNADGPRGRSYLESDLELLSMFGVGSSVASVVVFGLFVGDVHTVELYRRPSVLWLTMPILIGWTMRIWLAAHRGELNEDPIVYALRDRLSLIAAVAIVLVFTAATVIR